MKIDLIKISAQENDLIKEAEEKFTEEFKLCIDGLSLLSGIKNFAKELKMFPSFYSLTYNSFLCSILSAIRKHENQAMIMIRPSLEAGVLMVYSLYSNNESDYGKTIEGEFFLPSKSIKNKAYNWLEMNYPEYSQEIKNAKDSINESYMHSNIVMAQSNSFEESNRYVVSNFGTYPESHIKAFLVYICTFIPVIIDMLIEVKKHIIFLILKMGLMSAISYSKIIWKI